MRHILIAAILAVFAIPAHAATPEQEAELRQLEQRLQPLIMNMSGAITAKDVGTALGVNLSDTSFHHCDNGCEESTFMWGGVSVRHYVLLARHSSSWTRAALKRNQLQEAESWQLWFHLSPALFSEVCLSVEGWNTALIAAGWPALKLSNDWNNGYGKVEPVLESVKDERYIVLSPEYVYPLRAEMPSQRAADIPLTSDCIQSVTAVRW